MGAGKFSGKNGREACTLSGASVEGYYIEAQMTEIARRVNAWKACTPYIVRRVCGRLPGRLYIHCQESRWKARRQASTPNIVRRVRVSGRLQGRLVHTLSGD